MQERYLYRRHPIYGAQDEKWFRLEVGRSRRNAGGNVVIQTGVRIGKDAKFLAEIQDIRSENGTDNEKERNEVRFPFIYRRRKKCHGLFSFISGV